VSITFCTQHQGNAGFPHNAGFTFHTFVPFLLKAPKKVSKMKSEKKSTKNYEKVNTAFS
jgi:hypothetical protein